MNETDKIKQLQAIIRQQLSPLVNRDYWLLNVPYHENVGDTLIYQGEMDFLASFPYRCKGVTSYNSPIPDNIPQVDIILIHGGGNFGDLWDTPMHYQMNIVQTHPNNQIIFLPQTVWFEHKDNLNECAEILSRHDHLTICARDRHSFELLKANFRNDILLVPDMAFCMDMTKWRKPAEAKGTLLLKRSDKELKEYKEIECMEEQGGVTVTDWLPVTQDCWQKTWFRRTRKYVPVLYDCYARHIFRPYMINSGIRLIGSHKRICSTRLHAAILSILLGKAEDLTWFDNSYGKNSSFYETWLSDMDGITFIK